MFQQTRHFLLIALAGFINRQQQDLIAYLQEENRILREKLGGKATGHTHGVEQGNSQ